MTRYPYLDRYAMSLFHMFMIYAIIRGRSKVRKLTSNRELDSIVTGLDNHRTSL